MAMVIDSKRDKYYEHTSNPPCALISKALNPMNTLITHHAQCVQTCIAHKEARQKRRHSNGVAHDYFQIQDPGELSVKESGMKDIWG